MHKDLIQLRRKARQCFNQLRKEDSRSHSSFSAELALLQAAQNLSFEHSGIEGFTFDDSGKTGVQWLNVGDSYVPTVLAVCSRDSARFYVGDGEFIARLTLLRD